MSELIEGASAPDVQSGADVMDAQVFGDLWAYIMENHTENDGELLKLYIAMRGACAVIEKELNIPRMEVTSE
ncbi:hypothetical protein uav_050 [Pseudomonas phage UAVern]|uniref:Uncharacterized protein n=1 Tax=Pseudomonas phage UAVern TaxID=2856997 RepID=A0A975YZ68_9CAUD|nr:hypothetical protein uav_050 [Pseudomonas phage UAVern]